MILLSTKETKISLQFLQYKSPGLLIIYLFIIKQKGHSSSKSSVKSCLKLSPFLSINISNSISTYAIKAYTPFSKIGTNKY